MSEDQRTTHEFQAEVEQVLSLVIGSLYSNREIFLRELVSNAADALDKYRFHAATQGGLDTPVADLVVRLIPDRDAGTLTIWDNGIGMSREELVENLGTVAKSGTRELAAKLKAASESSSDMNLIGQFGVGFYSAWLVADQVAVISQAQGADEAHRWSSDARTSFTVEPAEREGHGTSVVLTLKEDQREYLDPVRLRTLVERYSDYLSWPIELATSKKEGDGYVEGFEKINEGSALWRRPKGEITDERCQELYGHLSGDLTAPLAYRHFAFEGTQEFSGILFVPAQAPMALWMPEFKHGVRLYVKRVFIMDDAEALLPRWLRFVRGVVDSEDLPLNVSRELLQDSSVTRVIRKQIIKQVLDLLADLAKDKPEAYETFWKMFGAVLKEGLHEDPAQKDRIAPLLRFESSTQPGLSSLAEAKERMKEGQKALYYVLAESRAQAHSSPHIEMLSQRGYEVLYLIDPVDPFAVDNLREFDGVALVAAGDADLQLEDDGDEADKEAREKKASDLKPLCERFRVRLQDHISEVRLSNRLADSVACLVIPQGGLQPHLERMLRSAQSELPAQKRILEINPDHSVTRNLLRLLDQGDAAAKMDEWIDLIYDQAKVAEGSPLDDPGRYSRRINDLLAEVTASRAST